MAVPGQIIEPGLQLDMVRRIDIETLSKTAFWFFRSFLSISNTVVRLFFDHFEKTQLRSQKNSY